MNPKFIAKMVAAKKLEYEAFQTLMPERVKDEMDEISARLKKSMTEVLLECMKEVNISMDFAMSSEKTSAETNPGPTDMKKKENDKSTGVTRVVID